MIEGKGLGGKKVNRVNMSLTNKDDSKLTRLAIACNMKKTTLAGLIVEKCLNNPQFVAELQKEYCTQRAYKVLLIKDYETGEYNYILSGRDDLR